MKKYFRAISLLFLLVLVIFIPMLDAIGQDGEGAVHIIKVDGEITPAMASLLDDKIEQATKAGAVGVLIDISTLGGRVDSAIKMRDAIIESRVPVAVYISNRAISAGALISIAAETIIMAPGSHIGSAEPVPNEPKALAFVSGEFRTTAERRGRDPKVALAMVDVEVEIEGLVEKGQILDMTATEAELFGYADHIVLNRREAIEVMGWGGVPVVEQEMNFRYRIAQFLTSYEIASILLTLGMIGIIAEFFTQGFGVAGIAGISCFVLYFAGGIIAGGTQWWSILIFAAGLVLIIIETTVPGFGVFGISGIIAIFASMIFAAPTIGQGFGTVLIATIAAVISVPIFFKIFGKTKIMRRLVLSAAETTDQGYTHADRKDLLLGKTGVALTVLRPSGSVMIDDIKTDAITDGEYIYKGTNVKVIRIEGAKVIVSSDDK